MQIPRLSSPRSSTAHLAIAGVLLAFALTIFGAIVFAVFSAQGSAIDAATALSSKVNQEQMLTGASRIANETKTQRAALEALPIPPNGGAAFIAAVESLGVTAKASATVSSVSATAPQGATPGILTLSAHFSGSYAACTRFVRLVETLSSGVAVSNLALNYTPTTGVWSGTLSLTALSFDTP